MTQISIVGNATSDPETRFLPSGIAVSNFSVAVSQRQYDKGRKEWVGGDTMFLRVSAFRDLAENIANSVSRGQRVIVSGKLKSRTYEKDGEKRTVFEVEADEVGPSLRFATASVTKSVNGGGGGRVSAGDPWSQAPQSGGFGGGNTDPHAAPF
nr:single-stranded DNA-binding protein [Rhodococcus ruber]